jgi:hypothetical protein
MKEKGLAAASIALQKMTEMEKLREEAKKLLSKKPTKKKSTGGDLKSDSANQMSNRDIEVAKRLLEAEKKNKKALGGKIQTEYRGGGAVNLGNYKGQF